MISDEYWMFHFTEEIPVIPVLWWADGTISQPAASLSPSVQSATELLHTETDWTQHRAVRTTDTTNLSPSTPQHRSSVTRPGPQHTTPQHTDIKHKLDQASQTQYSRETEKLRSKQTRTKQQPPASIDFLESKGLLRVTQTLRRMSKTVNKQS